MLLRTILARTPPFSGVEKSVFVRQTKSQSRCRRDGRPVGPGGVGPMTIAVLLDQTVQAAAALQGVRT
nr:hypothetical protein [Rhodococcus sp. (in: high G+C Gram-positive bacteria)]